MNRLRTTVLAVVLGALATFILLIPAYGNDSDPPECFSYIGYVVPCGFGPDQSQGAGSREPGPRSQHYWLRSARAAGRRDDDRAEARGN